VLRKSDSVDSVIHVSPLNSSPKKIEIVHAHEQQEQHFCKQQKRSTRLKKVNSMSTNSISSVGQTSSSASNNNSITMMVEAQIATSSSASTGSGDRLEHESSLVSGNKNLRSSSANSSMSFTKEIKNLLEIAESRAKLVCKVYDSSLNDEENESRQLKRFSQPPRFGPRVLPSGELLQVKPSDYKSIITSNYLNSSKKTSNVISKVKLWDQLLQSGRVNCDSWKKEFILN
jgi:hypothetical protein